jgi:hypothetical protein
VVMPGTKLGLCWYPVDSERRTREVGLVNEAVHTRSVSRRRWKGLTGRQIGNSEGKTSVGIDEMRRWHAHCTRLDGKS